MATTCKLIASLPISGTHVGSFFSVPQTFTDLLVVGASRVSGNVEVSPLSVQFNGVSGTGYSSRRLYGTGGVVASDTFSGAGAMLLGVNATTQQTANTFASTEIYIPNYASTSANKSASCTSTQENNAATSYTMASSGSWASTSAIAVVTLFDNNGYQFVTGTQFYLYGITRT